MTDIPPTAGTRRAFWTIALLSAALLAFQVLLTRVCALRLHFHFGFLIISNSLLGIGAAGSLLALFEARWRRDPAVWIWGFSVGFLLSLPLCWMYLLTAQIPETLHFGTLAEIGQFALFNFACTVPFFFGGTAVGLILSANAVRVHSVYAADLFGAGLGCLLCPILLWPVGAGGCLMVCVLLAVLAAACAVVPQVGIGSRLTLALAALVALFWMPRFDRDFPVPGKVLLDVTRDYNVVTYGRPIYSQWSANSRIDVLLIPQDKIHLLQARGDKALAMPLPKQGWIAQDGDAGTFLSDFSGEPDKREVLRHTTYFASLQLKQGTAPKVLVIGVGGATDLWAAKLSDASLIRGIELNQAVLDVHTGVGKAFSRDLLADPRVELVCDEGRSALARERQQFDIIQLTGIDTWTALTSGAYVLAENYLYTVEACRQMYDKLTADGVLQIARMAAEAETTRLLSNLYAALPAAQQPAFEQSVAAFGTRDGLITVLLKKSPFREGEVAQLERWADDNGIQKVVLPGRDCQNRIQPFVTCSDKQAFIDSYPLNVSPTTDDQPYFFSFLRWGDVDTARQWIDKPTQVVQGNPLFLWGQLLGSSLAALLLIVLPLLFRRGTTTRSRRGAGSFLVYFAGLGIGFIAVEVALIQKFTLLLGQPLYSIVVTLFALLIATGCGSFLSQRLLAQRPQLARLVPVAILLLLLLVAFGSRVVVDACIGLPLFWRALATVLVTAPVGVLLGVPFAHGIDVVQRLNPSFVPWAWAVNGSTTVVGSILTVILSMNFGFSAVLLIAGGVYLVAFAAIDRLARAATSPAAAAAAAA